MTTTKRKVSVSLDEDLVAELEAGGDALSSQVNDAVRVELERRRRHRLLGQMLDELAQVHGIVEEQLVAKYLDLLS
jgi:antitoxin CcdA